jgi:hypothetical protein
MRRLVVVLAAATILVPYASAAHKKPKIVPPPKLWAVVTAKPTTTLTLGSAKTPVKKLKASWYTLTIRDLSAKQNFHLTGPGVNRKTTLRFRGIAIWGVHLQPGVYHYNSDRASAGGGHTFRVVKSSA